MKCPKCGTENAAEARFCENCGATLAAQSEGVALFCSNCGRKNPAGARFCEDCGNAIANPGGESSIPPSTSRPVVQKKRSFAWLWSLFGLGLVIIASWAGYAYLSPDPVEPLQTPSVAQNQAVSQTVPAQESFTACSSENVLYSEDFEDRQIQNWSGDERFLSIITIAPGMGDSGNMVLIVQKPASAEGQVQAFAQLNVPSFSNAYLSVRFYVDGIRSPDNSDWFSFNWLFSPIPVTVDGEQVFDSRYQLPVGYNYFEMRRLQQPLTNISVDRSFASPVPGRWYQLEIATFDAYTTVWLDAEMVMDYRDSKPLPEGTLGFEAWLTDPDIRLLFDDIKLCKLNKPIITDVQ